MYADWLVAAAGVDYLLIGILRFLGRRRRLRGTSTFDSILTVAAISDFDGWYFVILKYTVKRAFDVDHFPLRRLGHYLVQSGATLAPAVLSAFPPLMGCLD